MTIRSDSEKQSCPDVTVVLLVHKPGSWEKETVRRVRSQTYQGRVILHVVDSSPYPSSHINLWMKERADIWETIPPEAFHHAKTRNRAVDACSTPVIVFLSQDAHPLNETWLPTLVRPLLSGEAEASYGRQRPATPSSERQATFAFLYPDRSEIKTLETVAELGIRAFHFTDVCSAFLTEVIARVRFPEYIPFFEDVGVAIQLLLGGRRIAYVSEAVVVHSHEMTWTELYKRYVNIGTVYEQLGIFQRLKASSQNSDVKEGLRVIRALIAAPGRTRTDSLKNLATAGLKVFAITTGRLKWRHRAFWGFDKRGSKTSRSVRTDIPRVLRAIALGSTRFGRKKATKGNAGSRNAGQRRDIARH